MVELSWGGAWDEGSWPGSIRDGRAVAFLVDQGAREVTGIDVSPETIARAGEQYARPGLHFICRDALDLSGIGNVDLVTSFETIEHLADPDRFLNGITSVLLPEGLVLVSTPVRQSGTLQDKPENPYHVREWNSGEFTALLRKYFTSVQILHQYDVRKSWFPYSRTLRRKVMSLLNSVLAERFETYPILSLPPETGGIAVYPAFVIGVCKGPLRSAPSVYPGKHSV